MARKRLGILTFHNSRNYGAVLQTYALQKKMGETYEIVKIIDYRNDEIEKILSLWPGRVRGIREFAFSVLAYVFRLRKKVSFEKFLHKYMMISERIEKEGLKNLSSEYDVLVAGSDQIWNTALTGNDTTYFLDFVNGDCLKVAYAASFGDTQAVLTDQIKGLLQGFDLITLREDNMKDAVVEAVSGDIELCCDPSLFLSGDEWIGIASKRLKKRPYIFVFMIEVSESLIAYAKKLADDKNLILISNKNCFSFFRHPSPSDFLSWIYNAEYVLTNSFHGTVFSVLFQKQFLSHVMDNEGQKRTRITHFLKVCGLEHRTLSDAENRLDFCEKWDEVKEKTDAFGKASLDYIRKRMDKLYEER